MTLSLPGNKIDKITKFAKFLRSASISTRLVSSFIKLLVSYANAFIYAPLNYTELQFCLMKCLSIHSDLDSLIHLDK